MRAVEQLRALVKEATPGPWEVIPESDDGYVIGQFNERWPQPLQDPVGRFGEEDARLIALAPQLAELVADMGEALREMEGSYFFTLKSKAALARLDALFSEESVVT